MFSYFVFILAKMLHCPYFTFYKSDAVFTFCLRMSDMLAWECFPSEPLQQIASQWPASESIGVASSFHLILPFDSARAKNVAAMETLYPRERERGCNPLGSSMVGVCVSVYVWKRDID